MLVDDFFQGGVASPSLELKLKNKILLILKEIEDMIKVNTFIFCLVTIICNSAFAQLARCTDGANGIPTCVGTYPQSNNSGGNLSAYTPPPAASTQGSTPSPEAMRAKECSEKKGAAQGKRASCKSDRSADLRDNIFACPVEASIVTEKIDSSGTKTITTTNPRQVCMDKANSTYTAGVDKCESDYRNTSLPSGCQLDP